MGCLLPHPLPERVGGARDDDGKRSAIVASHDTSPSIGLGTLGG